MLGRKLVEAVAVVDSDARVVVKLTGPRQLVEDAGRDVRTLLNLSIVAALAIVVGGRVLDRQMIRRATGDTTAAMRKRHLRRNAHIAGCDIECRVVQLNT